MAKKPVSKAFLDSLEYADRGIGNGLGNREVQAKRLDDHCSGGHDPARRYKTRKPTDEYDCEGRPGGKRLEKHNSRGKGDDPVPSKR